MNLRLWLALIRFDKRQKAAERLAAGYLRKSCPQCNPTARAIDYVRIQWIVAGIDRDA